jgi:hypothetical protein
MFTRWLSLKTCRFPYKTVLKLFTGTVSTFSHLSRTLPTALVTRPGLSSRPPALVGHTRSTCNQPVQYSSLVHRFQSLYNRSGRRRHFNTSVWILYIEIMFRDSDWGRKVKTCLLIVAANNPGGGGGGGIIDLWALDHHVRNQSNIPSKLSLANQCSNLDFRSHYCALQGGRALPCLGPEGNGVSPWEGGKGGPGPPDKEQKKKSSRSKEGGIMEQEEDGKKSQAWQRGPSVHRVSIVKRPLSTYPYVINRNNVDIDAMFVSGE